MNNNSNKLKLSYIDSSLWWKRTLKINSKKWKELRLKILKKNNYKCFFCNIKSSKYMIIDHINGDATNNNLENLRVNCPMCDAIRHCGLSGIKETIEIKKSSLDQIEIIEKTRKFYLENKKCPRANQIDKKCKNTKFLPIDIASKEEKNIIEKLKIYKAFFTNKFNFSFLNYLLI